MPWSLLGRGSFYHSSTSSKIASGKSSKLRYLLVKRARLTIYLLLSQITKTLSADSEHYTIGDLAGYIVGDSNCHITFLFLSRYRLAGIHLKFTLPLHALQ
jgi:hypothetical protein